MIAGILLWIGIASAAEDDALRRVIRLEWSGAGVAALVPERAGARPAVRARLALALGRSGDPQALEHLASLSDDPDETVRLAVARALLGVRGAASVARDRLDALSPPEGAAARQDLRDSEWAAWVALLGVQGGPEDVPRLLAWLHLPGEAGAGVARSLGWLGERDALGSTADQVRQALLSALHRSDRRISRSAAEALVKTGLSPDHAAMVGRFVSKATDGPTQSQVLTAAWPVLDPELRQDLFLQAMVSPWRGVQVSSLRALGPGEVDPFVLGTWLASPDPWVRWAVVAALGEAAQAGETSDDLRTLALGPDPYLAQAARDWLEPGAPEDEATPTAPGLPPDPPGVELDPLAGSGWKGLVLETSGGTLGITLYPELAPLAVHSLLQRAGDLPWTVDHLSPDQELSLALPEGPLRPEPSHLALTAGAICLDRTAEGEGRLRIFTGSTHALPGQCTVVGQVRRGMHVARRLQPGDTIQRLVFEELTLEEGRR